MVLYGPKAAGKSQIAEALYQTYGVRQLDADEIVLDLLSHGSQPDPLDGWLIPVERAVMAALRDNVAVSIEATGAWDSDWQLAQDLHASGVRVLRVWVCAPLEMTLDRLARRVSRKVPTTQEEARSIYTTACARARNQTFDLTLDTGVLRRDQIPDALAPLASSLTQ